MRQVHITNNEAQKIGGAGTLEYQLWVDNAGYFYVQLKGNTEAGTLSPLLFSVAEYAPHRNSSVSIGKPGGIKLDTGNKRQSGNNDDGAFLKAVLLHLLDDRAAA